MFKGVAYDQDLERCKQLSHEKSLQVSLKKVFGRFVVGCWLGVENVLNIRGDKT